MNYNITKHIIVLFISINIVIAQFINVETNIDLRQIRENDRFYFDNFREDVTNFFILNTFGTDLEYLELSSNVHIIIESIIDNNNQKIINAQVVITNRSDIMMTLKSFSFPINELKNISYNPNSFSPLNSLLEFIAHILIANETSGKYEYNEGLNIE